MNPLYEKYDGKTVRNQLITGKLSVVGENVYLEYMEFGPKTVTHLLTAQELANLHPDDVADFRLSPTLQ